MAFDQAFPEEAAPDPSSSGTNPGLAAALRAKRAKRGAPKAPISAEPPADWDGGPIFFAWKEIGPLGEKLDFLLPAPEKANVGDEEVSHDRPASRKEVKAEEQKNEKRKREREEEEAARRIGGGISKAEARERLVASEEAGVHQAAVANAEASFANAQAAWDGDLKLLLAEWEFAKMTEDADAIEKIKTDMADLKARKPKPLAPVAPPPAPPPPAPPPAAAHSASSSSSGEEPEGNSAGSTGGGGGGGGGGIGGGGKRSKAPKGGEGA